MSGGGRTLGSFVAKVGSEAAKQLGLILGCHAELVSASCNRHGDKTLKRVQGDKVAFTLAEVFHPAEQSKRTAFTLAEVLITLAIIGVVAALTMPSLITKHQEKQTVVKLKRMYSILSQAYTMHLRENEPVFYPFSEQGAVEVFNIFKPYLKIAKDCGLENGDGCIYTGKYGNKNDSTANYRAIYATDKRYYKILLNDGSSIIFRGGTSDINTYGKFDIDIFYDVNGAKGPNRWGHDLFEFLTSGRQIFPSGVPGKMTYDFDSFCAPANGRGDTCAAWVVYKENMDYLHCDDLTWNGKQKCN